MGNILFIYLFAKNIVGHIDYIQNGDKKDISKKWTCQSTCPKWYFGQVG